MDFGKGRAGREIDLGYSRTVIMKDSNTIRYQGYAGRRAATRFPGAGFQEDAP